MAKNGARLLWICLSFLILTSLFAGGAFAAPYATTPDVPDNMANRAWWVKKMGKIQKNMPALDQIAIRPYPGAVVTTPISKGKGHNVIQLVTTDSIETVETYYKGILSEWQHAEKYMNPCFFRGSVEEFNPLDPGAQELPYLVLTPVIAGGYDSQLVPGAKTRLQIYYAPNE